MEEAVEQLVDWLLFHEDDIAQEINDFGELKGVFLAFVGRHAIPNYLKGVICEL